MPLPNIHIQGTLVADPELRFTPNGVAVATMRVATNDRRKDEQGNWVDGDACFLDVQVWRNQAENSAESMRKGDRVVIIGRLKQRTYETKTGEARTVYEVEAEAVSLSLEYATAKATKTNAGRTTTPTTKAQDDPWAVPSADVPF